MIENAGKSAYIVTFVDRKTKLLLAKIMPDKRAATLNRAAIRTFKSIPAQMRNTLTVDNGKEFAAHKSLSHTLGIEIYFAHPYQSGEGGLTEHTNGVLDSTCLKKYRLRPLPQGSCIYFLEGIEEEGGYSEK
jgi:IS30 family transposase